MIKILKSTLLVLMFVSVTDAFSQDDKPNTRVINGREKVGFNLIDYAVPFLTIAPDSRAGAMGDVGVATSPDINSQHWNAAKYAKIKGDGGVSLTYTPWLKGLHIDDISLMYLSGYYKVDQKQVVAASLRYFSLGQINFTDATGQFLGTQTPNEFALDASYSRLFSDKISGGLTFRFVRSDLTSGSGDASRQAGVSVSADLSMYYEDEIELDGKPAEFAFGVNVSNLGRKISYLVDNINDEFIPSNLRVGSRLTMDLDEYNQISLAVDINKLLVPTPPLTTSGDTIVQGMDDDVSEVMGWVQSFYDAPEGVKEELRELMYSAGLEYWYSQQFAIRAGYFHENEFKGNRKYFTLGVGMKLNILSLDFAYLVPTDGNTNPLANTMRFTLSFEMSKFKD